MTDQSTDRPGRRQPISITFRDAVGFDGDVKVGDLLLTPAFPIAGLSLTMVVGQIPELTLDVIPHNGWSVDAKEALVTLRELVQVETIQDMRTPKAKGDLKLIAADLRSIGTDFNGGTANERQDIAGEILDLARKVDDIAKDL